MDFTSLFPPRPLQKASSLPLPHTPISERPRWNVPTVKESSPFEDRLAEHSCVLSPFLIFFFFFREPPLLPPQPQRPDDPLGIPPLSLSPLTAPERPTPHLSGSLYCSAALSQAAQAQTHLWSFTRATETVFWVLLSLPRSATLRILAVKLKRAQPSLKKVPSDRMCSPNVYISRS